MNKSPSSRGFTDEASKRPGCIRNHVHVLVRNLYPPFTVSVKISSKINPLGGEREHYF